MAPQNVTSDQCAKLCCLKNVNIILYESWILVLAFAVLVLIHTKYSLYRPFQIGRHSLWTDWMNRKEEHHFTTETVNVKF